MSIQLNRTFRRGIPGLIFWVLALSACQAAPVNPALSGMLVPSTPAAAADQPTPPPASARPAYSPGELVEYVAQTGDTLQALAAHFNTTVDEILAANPIIPSNATTMPPGMPMQIPIYFQPFWGTPYQIIPDSLFVNGPAQTDFNTQEFISAYPGWLKGHQEFAAGANRSGAGVVDFIAEKYSLSPRLLLALLEHEAGALSQSAPSQDTLLYPLGRRVATQRGLFLQLSWVANLLNDSYYRRRTGDLEEFDLLDGRIERPDPWQNAATVALQHFFSARENPEEYAIKIGPEGFAQTYRSLFGDPWTGGEPHIPGSLEQPILALPFETGTTWAYTGGPHTAWGSAEPLAALDFAPPAVMSGCTESQEWATAVADGVIARSEPATVVLDLDGDGDERTGWVIFYFHLASQDQIAEGEVVQKGAKLGHPSCEGGQATGTHIHIARKYNGEWIPAGGIIPFNLSGWVAGAGDSPYQGRLERFGRAVQACVCSNQSSHIRAEEEAQE